MRQNSRKILSILSTIKALGRDTLHSKIYLIISVILLIILSVYILPFIFTLDPYNASEYLLRLPGFISPEKKHYFLGTDDLGRDILSRLIFGARTTLSIGFFVVILSLIIGSLLGFLATVYGGFLDFVVRYFTDVMMVFPSILLTVLLLAMLGPGLITSVVAITVVTIPGFIRVAKTVAAEEIKKDYIVAARSFGLSRFNILKSELLPNCLTSVMVQATFAFSDAILTISILGFLHLGISPPIAEWGSMLADAYPFMESAPYLVIFPGLCIFFTVLVTNLLGDQLLDQVRER